MAARHIVRKSAVELEASAVDLGAVSAVILAALDRAGLDLPALKISIETVAKEAVEKPFAGFKTFDACVLEQTGNGHSEESARKICGSLQAQAEKDDAEPADAGGEIPIPREDQPTIDPTFTEKVLAKGFSIFKTAEERFVLGIVLEPTKELNKPDSQGDIYSAAEVAKAADNFMEQYQQIGVQHKEMTEKVKILRNWITLEDTTIDGQPVAKGTWILGVRVQDDDLWQKVKDGEITAFSIGGKANREPVT